MDSTKKSMISGDTTRLRTLRRRMQAINTPAFRTALSRTLAEEGVRQVGESFRHGRDPYGEPWKESLRAMSGGQTLRDRGTLQRSVTYSDVSDKGFRLGSNIVYARIHNLGGIVRAKTAKGLRFWVDAGHDIASAKTNLRTRKTSYRRTKPRTRKRMVIVSSVTIPRRTYIPTRATGGLGRIWAAAFRSVTSDLLRKIFKQ